MNGIASKANILEVLLVTPPISAKESMFAPISNIVCALLANLKKRRVVSGWKPSHLLSNYIPVLWKSHQYSKLAILLLDGDTRVNFSPS